jgi:release factor glutamine methyltransferase
MDFRQAQSTLFSQLRTIYDEREAAVIADWVIENITGQKKIDRILLKHTQLPLQHLELLEKYTGELLTRKPVQYVLQESWFCGMKFFVNEHVLIPRPETEELVAWVVEEATSSKLQAARQKPQGASNAKSTVRDPQVPAGLASPGLAPSTPLDPTSPTPANTILDIGTGSGCIAIALQKQLPHATVFAGDLSSEALAVAQQNATSLQAPIHLLQTDFLNHLKWADLPAAQFLVSNPPYIPLSDKPGMARHVVDFEPHLALFVADNDPLIFYRALADFARIKLLPGGALLAEMHEDLATDVANLFREAGSRSVEVRKDMQGKDRMIKATW